jgi:hypothetical protein
VYRGGGVGRVDLPVCKKLKTKLKTIMKKNMGNADRIIRVILAVVFGVLYSTGTVTGTLGLVLVVLAAVFVLTSLVSFCPLYALVGLSTCPTKTA